MGKLFDARVKIENFIEERNLHAMETKGKIGLKVGFVISRLKEDTPDDPEKLEKLKEAVKEVLNISI